jgi:glycosyltransferase involved in cell wall biosynthesis
MIGVCIPAHNEESEIERCLASATRAARHPDLQGEPAKIIVVLDACTDRTRHYALTWPVTLLVKNYRNVGLARAAGARHLLAAGARWLAFTDADTAVSDAWLVHQLSLRAEVVCGTVSIADWSSHGALAGHARAAFLAKYQDRDGHRHVHGANLGIDASVYQRLGGFEALACSEDQALVDKLEHAGASIAWTSLPRVVTSARPFSRIALGFASDLRKGWPQDSQAPIPEVPTNLP